MGSIEMNVKDAGARKGGRNEAYVSAVESKMASLDAAGIADRAIKSAQPSIGEKVKENLAQMADSAQRAAARMREGRERDREAAEVFGEAVTGRYLVTNEGGGKVGLYEQGSRTPAITIEKHKITTPHDNGAAVRDAVKLAVDRGWTSLKVEGSQEFKDAVWHEAKKYDLKVGHKPSPVTKAEFEKWQESNDVIPLPASSIDKPAQRQTDPRQSPPAADLAKRDLAKDFIGKSSEQRLNDPALRNAELTAQAARKLATDKFGTNDPKLKVALASVDKMVSDQLSRGHTFSTPKVVTKIVNTPKPDNKHQFHRPGV